MIQCVYDVVCRDNQLDRPVSQCCNAWLFICCNLCRFRWQEVWWVTRRSSHNVCISWQSTWKLSLHSALWTSRTSEQGQSVIECGGRNCCKLINELKIHVMCSGVIYIIICAILTKLWTGGLNFPDLPTVQDITSHCKNMWQCQNTGYTDVFSCSLPTFYTSICDWMCSNKGY